MSPTHLPIVHTSQANKCTGSKSNRARIFQISSIMKLQFIRIIRVASLSLTIGAALVVLKMIVAESSITTKSVYYQLRAVLKFAVKLQT